MKTLVLFAALVAAPALAQTPPPPPMPKPAALVADGVPPVPAELAQATRPYMEFRSVGLAGWTADRAMLITTRFANTSQLHRVAQPGGDRTQLTFEQEPVGASVSPDGRTIVATKDSGGNEFFQLYGLRDGQLMLLTDGRSRNGLTAWSRDGNLVGFSSTKRNGRDTDLYVMRAGDPASTRLVAQVAGGGWALSAFAPDGKSALVTEFKSVQKSNVWLLDLASNTRTPVGDHAAEVSLNVIGWASDGTVWAVSDEGADFARLGRLDRTTGRFTPLPGEDRWDVDAAELSQDGRLVAYVVNEAGISRLKLLDVATGRARAVDLPAGVIGTLHFASWGELGFTLSSARSPSDAYSLDPATLKVTRWTFSETGGLDPAKNVEPVLVEVKSFDGLPVSGFLYRPDPARFPGRRPLIVSIHGGPEAQSTPGFLGRSNYLLNELGIAIFLPNVRGSTGYGKRFVSLDNGPFKREDAVKDIGAFLDTLARDPALDPARFAVAGGSYGGYMCYASAIRYGPRLRAAQCTVAISNFVTFLEKTEGYRRDLRRVEYGDERDPSQRAKLLEISPLTRVAELKLPLFVVTGGNDPRVPAAEADQIIRAVRANGGTAWHLLGENEGHGFAKKENQDYQFWSTLQFWQQHLLTAGR